MEPHTLQPHRPLTRQEVREVDRRAIEDLGLPGIVLMENAGLGLTDRVQEELSARGAPPGAEVGIAVGRGNNGGDGLVLARHLLLRGFQPRVVFCGALSEAPRTGDAGVNLAVCEASHVELAEALDPAALRAWLAARPQLPLLVDALYGTGLRGALREPGLGYVQALAAAAAPIVAVDIPSGLDCDAGVPLGAAVRAARTVTFVARKAGFDAEGAEAYTGRVDVVSIGCPPAAWSHVR
jgi:NAD(P)H-hydrate epimerase